MWRCWRGPPTQVDQDNFGRHLRRKVVYYFSHTFEGQFPFEKKLVGHAKTEDGIELLKLGTLDNEHWKV